MRNSIIDRIFDNIDKLIDEYTDSPETIAAENRFWEYVNANYIKGAECKEEIKMENVLYDLAACKEKQGFLYGFHFAMSLMGKKIG